MNLIFILIAIIAIIALLVCKVVNSMSGRLLLLITFLVFAYAGFYIADTYMI